MHPLLKSIKSRVYGILIYYEAKYLDYPPRNVAFGANLSSTNIIRHTKLIPFLPKVIILSPKIKVVFMNPNATIILLRSVLSTSLNTASETYAIYDPGTHRIFI